MSIGQEIIDLHGATNPTLLWLLFVCISGMFTSLQSQDDWVDLFPHVPIYATVGEGKIMNAWRSNVLMVDPFCFSWTLWHTGLSPWYYLTWTWSRFWFHTTKGGRGFILVRSSPFSCVLCLRHHKWLLYFCHYVQTILVHFHAFLRVAACTVLSSGCAATFGWGALVCGKIKDYCYTVLTLTELWLFCFCRDM